ncbi:PAS domain-containing protein [Manganibacter manganicus]|uniref:PAS domain-containing protein n=1 Tax=Manganibacter manganicus TaxID=1873176 RepID=A0A1V8RU20_9HYPH|nr:PAS domain-containing protein [Pseudaminobacter manganicus]OQM76682.1 PAS domain-containing protein [Pseudaminobacter manganicus]
MRLNGSIALFQYWNRLRDGRPAPRRNEIEPADIRALLADTFILEKDTRGEAVFRLAGTRLCASYGRELKGFSFPSLWRERDRRVVARLVQEVFDRKSLVLVSFEGISLAGRSANFELLVLPLDGGTSHPRCLGVASTADRPFWLGSDPIVDAVIDAVRTVDPNEKTAARVEIAVPALDPSEPGAPQAIEDYGRARRIRHLLVLDGGREE